MSEEPKQQTISPQKLEQLTGFTDRHHLRISKLGWYPPKVNREWLLVPTLQGLFKYYREQQSEESPLNKKRLEKIQQEIDLGMVDLALRRNEVIEVETVFRVWENVAMAIRRTILMSDLTEKEKDGILKELQSVTAKNYVEQREHDQGVEAEIQRGVPGAGADKQKPVGREVSAPVG